MAVDYAAYQGEAATGAGEFLLQMQTLECAEKLPGESHIEACHVVTDEVSLYPFYQHGAKFDYRLFFISRELPRIAQQGQRYYLLF